MGESVGVAVTVCLLLFSSLLFLGTVDRINTSGTSTVAENHNHRVLKLLEAGKEHGESIRVSDKPPQRHFPMVLDQQLRNEHSGVSRRLLQAEKKLKSTEEQEEVPFKYFLSTVEVVKVFDGASVFVHIVTASVNSFHILKLH
jgi:hypothetical protein